MLYLYKVAYMSQLYEQEKSNEFTRRATDILKLKSSQLFSLKFDIQSIQGKSLTVSVTIKGNEHDNEQFNMYYGVVKAFKLFNQVQQYPVFNESEYKEWVNFEGNLFFFHKNTFYSLEKNKELYDTLLRKDDLANKEQKPKIVPATKLVYGKVYSTEEGKNYIYFGLGFDSNENKKIMMLALEKYTDICINGVFDRVLAYNTINYDFLDIFDKSIFYPSSIDTMYTQFNKYTNSSFIELMNRSIVDRYLENSTDFYIPQFNMTYVEYINKVNQMKLVEKNVSFSSLHSIKDYLNINGYSFEDFGVKYDYAKNVFRTLEKILVYNELRKNTLIFPKNISINKLYSHFGLDYNFPTKIR